MASGSVDQNNNYVFGVRAHMIEETASRSIAYWSIGNGDDTMVTLWNPADEAQDFVFTLFFLGGHYRYAVHLGPREAHMFNLSEIVHNQIADDEGNVIPTTVHEGSARISGPRADNEHILAAIDAAIYNVRKATCHITCVTCNGATLLLVSDNPFAVTTNATHQLSFKSIWNTGAHYDLTTSSSWSSNHANLATVSTGLVRGLAAGAVTVTATTNNELIYLQECTIGATCLADQSNEGSGNAPGTVISFKATGKSYIFVGTDPNELYGNHYTLTDSTGTQNPQPSGGTCCANSSDPSDTVTQTGSNPPIFLFTTLDESTTVGDRTLTFEYSLSGGEAESQQMNVTARAFAYATNTSPSNACSLTYGTDRTYTYTVYTHPDHAALAGTDGLSGTVVTESFNSPLCALLRSKRLLP